jgi:SAM-dependent methyltransferase
VSRSGEGQVPRRLPRSRSVDLAEFLVRASLGRTVTHVGFTGSSGTGGFEPRRQQVHERLSRVAADLVGLDTDAESVERARANGYRAFAADCGDPEQVRGLDVRPAELVIAGELIERVADPGRFLDAMHPLIAAGGRLVVTTPNAASAIHVPAAVRGFELAHPDHVAVYSWFTLTNMLHRHGWAVRDFLTYHQGLPDPSLGGPGRGLVSVQRAAARLWPYIDAGLIAVAEES